MATNQINTILLYYYSSLLVYNLNSENLERGIIINYTNTVNFRPETVTSAALLASCCLSLSANFCVGFLLLDGFCCTEGPLSVKERECVSC